MLAWLAPDRNRREKKAETKICSVVEQLKGASKATESKATRKPNKQQKIVQ